MTCNAIFIFFFSCVTQSFAITLLIKDEALSRVFPSVDIIEEKKILATDAQIEAIKKALGGKLTHSLKAEKAEQVSQEQEFTFYFAKKENRLLGTALIIDEPGKWGWIKFIVRINPTGDIRAVHVMEYREVRGRPLASQNFLKQFTGRTIDSPLTVGRDIQGIAGATASSEAACFAMKKAMALYKELVLESEKLKAQSEKLK